MPPHTVISTQKTAGQPPDFLRPSVARRVTRSVMSAGLPARIQRFSPPSRFRSGMHYAWRKAVPYGSVTAQVLHLFPYYLPFREAPTAPLIIIFYSISRVNSTAFANKINLYRAIIFGYIPECRWEISSPKPGFCGHDYLCNDTKIRQRYCKLIFSWYNSFWQNVYTAAAPFRINARHKIK